ncbi:Pyruvate carboxylase 1, partial [Tetrabaena socialis]
MRLSSLQGPCGAAATEPCPGETRRSQRGALSIRGIKTNLPFLENVMRHPEFLSGEATTFFIEKHSRELFNFERHGSLRSSKLLTYLADMVVNGPDHPGAIGPLPVKRVPPALAIPEHLKGAPLTGWRDVLVKEGPDGWAKAVRAHKGLLITDTTMRDAHQSLLATRMRSHDLLKAAPATAHILANAGSLEMWGGATFDVREQTRELYAPFESNMKSVSSDVYVHEMPGGQYTNLKFQAMSLGLGEEWDKICTAYAGANRALGDIVKVTPSSKVVGDLAQFMVQNGLDEHSLVARAESLSFPSSVVEFMQGYLGQPSFGFPEPLRSRVLKGKPVIEGRPGASLAPMDLAGLEYRLKEKYGSGTIANRDVLSAALYPKVFDEYMNHVIRYSDLIEKLPTRAFLTPLEEDDEVEFEIGKGVAANIKYKAVGELQPNGKREVFFEANGVPRVVEVIDRKAEAVVGKKAVREKADLAVLGSVGAPMAGTVIE